MKRKSARNIEKAAAKGVAPPDTPSPEQETPEQRGKTLRENCPRSRHAEVVLGQAHRDPLSLLEESNHDRLESLLPIRFTRMVESPFAFFRGTAVLQAHDLQGTPSAGIIVQCCGDCHLMNFGGFATPERTLIFDISDFDETHPGPFEWDVKRLATSLVLAARWLKFTEREARDTVEANVRAYRVAMSRFAGMSVLETWYSRLTVDDLLNEAAGDPVIHKLILKGIKRARQNTSDHVFEKITAVVDGAPRIVLHPPLLFHSVDHDRHMLEHVRPFFKNYRETLRSDYKTLFDRYRIVDAAYKVVGVGSVGTRCFIALLMDPRDHPLFLQVKEARRSVLAGRAGSVMSQHDGERVVTGQRLMQSASDIFLGWTRGLKGRDYYVRQLRDMKIAPDLTGNTPRVLTAYGETCGKSLARAHAKTGEAALIAGYLGGSDRFDKAITNYAVSYADQVEKDYDLFRAAVRAGRFPIETLPSDIEQAIR